MEIQKELELVASPQPSFFKPVPPPFEHQTYTTAFYNSHTRVFDTSDPGTGKTRAALDAIIKHRKEGGKRVLVLAPKAILEPSWGKDIKTFAPSLSYSIATAPKRERAFLAPTDIVLTNHDAAKWLAENQRYLKEFDFIIIDEITAYKHHTSQRSKALANIVRLFPRRGGLTGTPIANHLLDIWHQALLLDDGISLGTQFYKFRMATCDPVQVGPGAGMVNWVEKPGAREAVADALRWITVRHKFEECVDIPEHTQRTICFTLDSVHRDIYDTLLEESFLTLPDTTGVIDAVHAAALTTKLLQVAAGSVYDSNKNAVLVDSERYELVMQLIDEREQCVVAFNWKHQRDILVDLAKKAKLSYAVIDGQTKAKELPEIVEQFQRGKIRVLFAQPQSASHGLTLTKGTTTIWVSPTYDAERFLQFNRRIYRAGQTRKTETLMIAAEDTVDERVYDVLTGKISGLNEMLAILKTTLEEPKCKKPLSSVTSSTPCTTSAKTSACSKPS
jgi:SNF2 family DNA or RNA helicase